MTQFIHFKVEQNSEIWYDKNDSQHDLNLNQQMRELVSIVDWPCSVQTLFSESNLGSGLWPHKSISWALSKSEKLLILEDDVRITKTFYELSYYLKRLDIIISCDSSIVHLCGILGVKCILLLNFNSDWRWFDNKHNTEWYPSVTIIKQKKFNDWRYVFEELNKRVEVIYKEKFYVN